MHNVSQFNEVSDIIERKCKWTYSVEDILFKENILNINHQNKSQNNSSVYRWTFLTEKKIFIFVRDLLIKKCYDLKLSM